MGSWPDRVGNVAWLAFALIWLIGAFTSKRSVRKQSWHSLVVQGLLVVLAFGLLFRPRLWPAALRTPILHDSDTTHVAAAALTCIGLAFAVWARFCIGGNWSGTVTVKRDHQLIRGGPYRIVRHPIYTGITLAALGAAFAGGELRSFLGVAVLLFAFKRKSLLEERFMTEAFGDQYKQYRREVKGLIPFVW
jgi:protein-S-isoprenylcysteine O-methyltransferase